MKSATSAEAAKPAAGADRHATCPYRGLPAQAYWKRSVTEPSPDEIDPVQDLGFRLSPTDAIATAGSCFAMQERSDGSDAWLMVSIFGPSFRACPR